MDVVVYGLAVVGALFIGSLLAGALWVAVVTVVRRRRPVQSTFHRPPTAGDVGDLQAIIEATREDRR